MNESDVAAKAASLLSRGAAAERSRGRQPLGIGPSFEEGWPSRSSKWVATLRSARPGRSNACRNRFLTSPRCALF